MLRSILRWPRSVRLPIHQDGPIEVRRVSISRARRQVSRVALTSFFVFCAIRSSDLWMPDSVKRSWNKVFGQYKLPGVSITIKSPEGVYRNTKPTKEKVEENGQKKLDEIALFKLPIWIRMKRQPMYKETDEEWITIARLQSDPARILEIKKEVTKHVAMQLIKREHVGNLRHIRFTKQQGQLAVRLDIVPPLYPPDVYEVPALLLRPKGMSFGWVQLPDSQGATMSRIFHPVVFGQAFYAGARAYVSVCYRLGKARFQDYFQLDTHSATQPTGDKKVVANKEGEHPNLEAQVKASLAINQVSEKDMKVILPFLCGLHGSEGEATRHFRDVVKSVTNQTALEHAMIVFQHAWVSRQTLTLQTTYPRGAVQVIGFIDCIGQRGKYRLEVTAYYSPTENAIVGKPVILMHYLITDLTKFTKDEKQNSVKSDLGQIQRSNPGTANPTPADVNKPGREGDK